MKRHFLRASAFRILARGVLGLAVLLPSVPAEVVGGALPPMRLGVPGLYQTVSSPHDGGAPLRFGLYFEHGVIDDGHGFDDPSFLPDVTTQQMRLQMALQWGTRAVFAATLSGRRYDVAAGGRIAPSSASGLSDLQLSTSWDLLDLVDGNWFTGLWGSLRLPTGDSEKGFSTGVTEGEVGLHSAVSLFKDSLKPETHVTFNVGYRFNRNEEHGYGVLAPEYAGIDSTGVFFPMYPALGAGDTAEANDQLLLRLALEVRQKWARLFLEYSADWLAWSPISSYRESPSWITPGISLGKESGFTFQASWAIGLWTDDPHTPFVPNLPDWMISAGISYPFFLGTRDRDGDGIKDKNDRCIDLPEDPDGFEDEDGCPDWDNDRDGIVDRNDLCPDQPEDHDGFEDQDGCPDLDNDGDGIDDIDDLCPDQPEDFNGVADEDGCPETVLDSDGDGIPDARDICPKEAEDFDGFEDRDGCPDLDNDLDGIPDTIDKCPLQPEDYNGIDDDDGCPDGESSPKKNLPGYEESSSGQKKGASAAKDGSSGQNQKRGSAS